MELDPRLVSLTLYFVIMGTTLLGFFGLPPDFEVDAEYISGMLTASSILFGFWVILIQTRPKERIQRWRYDNILIWNFFASLGSLILSIVMLYLDALNKISSVITLYVCMLSFLFNTSNLTIAFYYYKFKEAS